MNDIINSPAVQRLLASAWESGFHAGQVFGTASERHDPQWDMDPPPARPENPYRAHGIGQEK